MKFKEPKIWKDVYKNNDKLRKINLELNNKNEVLAKENKLLKEKISQLEDLYEENKVLRIKNKIGKLFQ